MKCPSKVRIRLGGLCAALASAAVLAGPLAATAETPTPFPAEPPTAVADPPPESLKLAADPTSRLSLEVLVNGQGPYLFLVDTGSDRTVISRELAATLQLPAGPDVLIHATAGADNVKTVVIDHLAVGNRILDHIEAPALSASDLGAQGILGIDALRDLHLVMDFKALRLTSSPSRSEPFDPQTIVVRGRSRFGQLILADSTIHGVPVLVVLDSGTQLSIGNAALLRLLTGHELGMDPRLTTRLLSVTGRSATVEIDTIAEANVGGITIRNMPLAFAQLSIFDHFDLTRQPALFLGMDVLSQCKRVSVDLRRREATFTLN